MASTGVPASSCRSPLTVSCKFNRHTVMSYIHLCPRCHFRFPNINRNQSDSWSPVVSDKNEKREKNDKNCHVSCRLLIHGPFKRLAAHCWRSSTLSGSMLAIHLCTVYIYCIFMYLCVCVCCRRRGSCSEMRGEVESVSFRRDLKWVQATGGGGEAWRGELHHPLPPPCASAEPITGRRRAEEVELWSS